MTVYTLGEPCEKITVRSIHVCECRHESDDLFHEHEDEKIFLGMEIIMHQSLVAPYLAGNLHRGCHVVTFFKEKAFGSLQYLFFHILFHSIFLLFSTMKCRRL